jgi:hypothetical protein
LLTNRSAKAYTGYVLTESLVFMAGVEIGQLCRRGRLVGVAVPDRSALEPFGGESGSEDLFVGGEVGEVIIGSLGVGWEEQVAVGSHPHVDPARSRALSPQSVRELGAASCADPAGGRGQPVGLEVVGLSLFLSDAVDQDHFSHPIPPQAEHAWRPLAVARSAGRKSRRIHASRANHHAWGSGTRW